MWKEDPKGEKGWQGSCGKMEARGEGKDYVYSEQYIKIRGGV